MDGRNQRNPFQIPVGARRSSVLRQGSAPVASASGAVFFSGVTVSVAPVAPGVTPFTGGRGIRWLFCHSCRRTFDVYLPPAELAVTTGVSCVCGVIVSVREDRRVIQVGPSARYRAAVEGQRQRYYAALQARQVPVLVTPGLSLMDEIPCPACGEDVDSGCPICAGLGRVPGVRRHAD